MSTWSMDDIDSLHGRIAIVTGGTSGIGLETARALASKGAEVIIAADDEAKGEMVLREIRSELPSARIKFHGLNLGSRNSIADFFKFFMREHITLDLLINNAGLDGVPERQETIDGHELMFGVNFLGHFALTARLFPLLLRSTDPRVVFVSGLKHRSAHLDFNDLNLKQGYTSDRAHSQAELAMLMTALELHRRCVRSGIQLRSIPVHPGMANTHIFDQGPKITRHYFHPVPFLRRLVLRTFGQKAMKGALPLLFAATSIEARSGIYYGPDSWLELWGCPTEAKVAIQAENQLVAEKLWDLAEKMTGVSFDVEGVRPLGLH